MPTFTDKLKWQWPLLALLLLHVTLQWSHLSLDFWNDELYTLEHFVCQPFGTAATDYRSTNNHVLFSLLAQCWARCLGIRAYEAAAMHPVLLRILPLFCSGLSVFWTYRLGCKAGGRWSGALAGIILLTSIPFWNYGAQLRGYGLSMAIYAALSDAVYAAWQRTAVSRLIIIALLSSVLLWTLPSNVYFLIAGIPGIAYISISNAAPGRRQSGLWILLAMLAGGILAATLYLPLLPQMRRLPIFSSGTASQAFEALRERMPVVAYHFLSGRYFLLLPLFAFLFLEKKLRLPWLICTLSVFLLPFLIADLRGNSTPYRVFLTGLPLLSVAAGAAMNSVLTRVRTKAWQLAGIAAVAAYCLITFAFQLRKTEASALRDIKAGQRSGDLYFQYNLHFFHPRTDAKRYMRTYAQPGIPLVECCRMDAELLKYLSMAGWDRMAAKKLRLLPALDINDTIDVLTERPTVLKDSIARYGRQFLVRQLLPGPRPVQIIRLIKP